MTFCKYSFLDKCRKDDRLCVFSEDCYEPMEPGKKIDADHLRELVQAEREEQLAEVARTQIEGEDSQK